MGAACSACSGIGFGSVGPNGYEDTGQPCKKCNPDAPSRAPGSFAPKKARNDTWEYVDGVPDRVIPSSEAQGPESFFSAGEIAAQRAKDAAREAAMGAER